MPETRFEDLLVIPLRTTETETAIDRRFIEVCEPGSIVVKSAVPNVPVILGAYVSNDNVVVCTQGHNRDSKAVAVVTISGIRKGRANRRFPIFTQEQASQNEQFWTKAYGDET